MKKFLSAFLFRGFLAASGGPIVLAIVYGILGATDTVSSFTPTEVTLGILTVTLLAFLVAGFTAIYQLEQLPLPCAILIHGTGLYAAYILIYLINGWLQRQLIPVLIFTGVFLAGYALIWWLVWLFNLRGTRQLNRKLCQTE